MCRRICLPSCYNQVVKSFSPQGAAYSAVYILPYSAAFFKLSLMIAREIYKQGADRSAPPTLLLCCVFMLRPALFLQQQNEIPDRQDEQGNH